MEEVVEVCSHLNCDWEIGGFKFTCPYCGHNFCAKHEDAIVHQCNKRKLSEGLPKE